MRGIGTETSALFLSFVFLLGTSVILKAISDNYNHNINMN